MLKYNKCKYNNEMMNSYVQRVPSPPVRAAAQPPAWPPPFPVRPPL